MNTLQGYFYAIAIVSCLLCAFVVAGKRAPKRFDFLIVYLVLEALRYVFQWLMIHPAAPAKSLWLGLLMISSFLVAPALWMFAREIAEGRAPPLRSLRGRHLAVIVAGALLTLPLLLRTYGGTEYGDPANPVSAPHKLLINATMLAAVVLFLCQVPYYLTACVRLLAGHIRLSRMLFSQVEPNSTGTLRLLIFIVCINWFVGLLRALHCMTLGADTGLSIVCCVLEVGVTAAVVMALMRRTTVFSLEDRALAEALVSDAEAAAGAAPPKYARSALDAPARARIQRKLAEALSMRQLHRDPGLTLRGLCEALKENPHYVSQVINQDLATNFHDLIKKHRIEDAMAALMGEPDLSVLEIAVAVGFNSKSTFNAAFRQHAGMTPRDFRRARAKAGEHAGAH